MAEGKQGREGGKDRLHFSWQDGFNVFAVIFGWAISQAEDIMFLLIFTAIALVFAVCGIWGHREYSRAFRMMVIIGIASLIGIVDAHQVTVIHNKELYATYGVLIPANDPQPLSKCPVPLGSVAFYVGDAVMWTKVFPYGVISSKGKNLLEIDRDKDGNIAVSAQVFDDRDNLIAKLDKGRYTATPYAARLERKDRSSLDVYDHLDELALEVRFVNSSAVLVLGKFRSPGWGSLKVEKSQMIINTPKIIDGRISGTCIGGTSVGAINF